MHTRKKEGAGWAAIFEALREYIKSGTNDKATLEVLSKFMSPHDKMWAWNSRGFQNQGNEPGMGTRY
jgi:hypothetical protein